jgi:hypothetical protein
VTKWWIVAAFALVLAAIVYVPIAQPPLEREPDLSFRVTTHDAFARRLQIGRDIISTYGPWGILQRGYDRRTDGAVLFVSALLGAAFAWGVFRLSRDAGAGALTTALVALAAASLVAAAGLDGAFTVIALLLVLSMLEPWSASRELPLVAALGAVALVKFSLLVFAVLVVAGVNVGRVVNPSTAAERPPSAAGGLRTRPTLHFLVFTVSLLVFWIAAGQQILGFPAFIAGAAEVARGYGAASSTGSGVPLALFAAAGLVLVCAVIERSVLRAAIIGGAALLLVRIGYIRADLPHTRVADALLLFLIGGYLLIRRARRVALIGGVVAFVVAVIAGAPVLADTARVQWSWLRNRGERLRALERELAVRAGPVPAVDGTIDSYPWGSAALIIGRRRYAPRPVFQSAMAWTAKLARINAEYLRGPRAPEWLWVEVGSIDGRLPLLDDGPSWLEMARRYDVAAARDGHLLLHRRAAPKPLPPALRWCTIDVTTSRLRDVLGRPQPVVLELTTADGQPTSWRAAPDMLRGGFIVSPLVTNVDELALLFAGDDRRRVTEVRVNGVRMPLPASGTVPDPSAPRTSLRR